ncbi:MAG: hypothetical protein HYZ22_06410 [Chloroflexi bacterium]|nr:hypothetical protein [Chloroflexota bacterium]
MLKPMKPKQTFPNNTILWILVGVLVISGIAAIVSAFNGGGGEDEVNAVYTNAAATLTAQQMTMQAFTPSVTPTTFTQTPTTTFTPLASPTLFATQASATSSSGGSGSGAVGCNNSVFVSDVTVPDDTVMTSGQTFTKTWKLQNTGSCAWTATYKVSFVSGNAMGGVVTAINITVQPGQSGDVSVAMKAPTTAGDAIGYWILTNDSGQNFGSSFYVKIKVGAAAATTGTATATATTAVSVPAAVSNVVASLTSCVADGAQYKFNGSLTWDDNSTNETGFKIYLNGVEFTSVSADVESYDFPTDTNSSVSPPVIGVASYNGAGPSATVPATGACP